MSSGSFHSVASWDALLAKQPLISVPPGDRPRGAISRADGVYLRRGMEVTHLSESSGLALALKDHSILIIVEADERTCRMTRIPHTVL